MSEVPLYSREVHQYFHSVGQDSALDSLNIDEFIPHEAGSPFGWIEPETAQYPTVVPHLQENAWPWDSTVALA